MAVSAKYATVATSATNVTLSDDCQTVDVVNVSGGGVIYCRADGVAASLKGDDCDVVPAVAGAYTTISTPGNTTVVSVIASASTDLAVVERIR